MNEDIQMKTTNENAVTTNIASADLRPLALLATGRTGADIERLMRDVRARCRRTKTALTWDVLEQALRYKDDGLSDEILHRIAVHEIGHALAFELTGLGKVTTVRLNGIGGKTEVAIDPERLQYADGLLGHVICIFGGRAAEMVVFGERLVGSGGDAQSDLGHATRIALDIETVFGLGEEHPLVHRTPTNPGDVLIYNPALADRVQKRLDRAERDAVTLLEPHRELIERLGRQLAAAQVLEGEAVRAALDAAQSG